MAAPSFAYGGHSPAGVLGGFLYSESVDAVVGGGREAEVVGGIMKSFDDRVCEVGLIGVDDPWLDAVDDRVFHQGDGLFRDSDVGHAEVHAHRDVRKASRAGGVFGVDADGDVRDPAPCEVGETLLTFVFGRIGVFRSLWAGRGDLLSSGTRRRMRRWGRVYVRRQALPFPPRCVR